MSVIRLDNGNHLSIHENTVNYFEISGRGANSGKDENKESFSDWGENTLNIGNYRVIPFGEENDIPDKIIDTLYPNHLAPRIQNRKVELVAEQGPYLYETEVDGEKYKRKPVVEPAITEWLESIDYEEKLHFIASQYYNTNVTFTKIFRDRAGLIGSSSSLAQIEVLSTHNCRLAYKESSKTKIPTHVIIGDFKNGKEDEYEVYPLFDRLEPTKYPVSIHYYARRSFGVNYYSMPEIYGALPWIKRSTAIPKVIEALTNNSLNIKWHITSPKEYWDQKRKLIQENLPDGEKYTEKLLDDLKEQILKKLSELLSGVENVGKFWHNETVTTIIGGSPVELGWKITPIEQKVKDYVKSQLDIATQSDFSVVAALGLHSALANVGADGKSDSGSEQLYALKIHQLTGVPLAEYYITKAFNDVIKFKFNKAIKIGFYHINPEREQDITGSNRVIEQTPL
ncbi:hypothetical protein [Aquimarina megaterium]|uniref:hypothetical protein n=1 Tax=Aquimarina megaterium TaxID=1443666 RepID=UPI000942D800|nr:hypothetical protein [Aquimarina megaterium]